MKRILALLLALVFVFSFAGCKKEKEPQNETPSYQFDIAALAKEGKMPESTYALGTAFKVIDDAYNASLEHIDEAAGHFDENKMEFTEGSVSYYYTSGPFLYYFSKDKKDEGLCFIVNFDTAYGFMAGYATDAEIKAAMPKLTPTVREAKESDLFFMPVAMEGCQMLIYEFDNIKLTFFMFEQTLVCTTLSDTNNWKL